MNYDNLGNLTQTTDGNGAVTAWEYTHGVFVEAALNSTFDIITLFPTINHLLDLLWGILVEAAQPITSTG